MKINKNQYKNTSDFKGRSGSATVNMDKLFLQIGNMISNYNYPELAVLREWVSNAHDAHVAAGVKRAVEVTLPSQLSPNLVVKDFGLGMSTDFVENTYLSFGSSSKDESDDEIGGFGQGGKSALAIASQYTMTTISEGLKSIYIFERSPMGGMDFKLVIEEVPTEEPSGVTVQVAVDRIDQFSDKNLNRVLAGWSNSEVKLNTGKEFFSIPDNATQVDYKIDLTDYAKADQPDFAEDIRSEKGYVLHGALDARGGKGLRDSLDLSWNDYVVLVGPVAYVFQPEITTSRVLKDYMVASVNIGDLSFPSSREVVEATRTNRQLVGLCFEKIVEEADKLLQVKADATADRHSALQLHRSPLAETRRDLKITFKGEEVPTTFKAAEDDTVLEYQQIGSWRGAKGYKLAEPGYRGEKELPLSLQLVVVVDDKSSLQAIRNNVRIFHSVEEHNFKEFSGYLLIAEKPSEWVKAAAKDVLTSSKIAEVAKEHRRKKREEEAAAKAAGLPAPAAPVRKTRRDRIGEYGASWLGFETNVQGQSLVVTRRASDLMDFYTNHFDPKKTLVLSTNGSNYSLENFTAHFRSFQVNPTDAQFLQVNTGAKIETLRLLLGDEVKIVELGSWITANFAKLATFKGRSPKEIVAELPFDVSGGALSLIESVGLKNLHPKYKEFVALSEELKKARETVSNSYYDDATRLIRSLLVDSHDYKIQRRPEFFLLESRGYYRTVHLEKDQVAALSKTMNHMVELWLDNLALEEAEALEAAEAAKLEAESEQDAKSAENQKSETSS